METNNKLKTKGIPMFNFFDKLMLVMIGIVLFILVVFFTISSAWKNYLTTSIEFKDRTEMKSILTNKLPLDSIRDYTKLINEYTYVDGSRLEYNIWNEVLFDDKDYYNIFIFNRTYNKISNYYEYEVDLNFVLGRTPPISVEYNKYLKPLTSVDAYVLFFDNGETMEISLYRKKLLTKQNLALMLNHNIVKIQRNTIEYFIPKEMAMRYRTAVNTIYLHQ